MNFRTIAVAVLLAGLIALLVFVPTRSSTGVDALDPEAAGESSHPMGETGDPGTLQGPAIRASKRSVVEGGGPVEASVAKAHTQTDRQEDEAGVGVIFGNVLNGDGTRFDRGKVLVFANGRRGKPLRELDLQGPNMEFRCELPAGRAYQMIVDPNSLEGDHMPPLVKSLNRKTLGSGDPIDPGSLDNFSFAYVALVKGEQHRQDLQVGLPARVGGRLLDLGGNPIEGALARLAGIQSQISGLSENCITGRDGEFQFKRVFPGEFRLTFTREAPWTPPLPLHVSLLDGDDRWLGDLRAGGGEKSIRGVVTNQDGEPFGGLVVLCYSDAQVEDGVARHNFLSALGHARTASDGSFTLEGLPATPVLVSLTPNYNPNEVLGKGHPAIWVPNLEVDLAMAPTQHHVGTHIVEESRPYEISGQVVFDEAWLADKTHSRKDLRVMVSQLKGQQQPDGIRRAKMRMESLKVDRQTGLFRLPVETPRVMVQVRFELKGHEDLVFSLQPIPLGSWSQEIRVPADFAKAE